jgi:hypothetical protein
MAFGKVFSKTMDYVHDAFPHEGGAERSSGIHDKDVGRARRS